MMQIKDPRYTIGSFLGKEYIYEVGQYALYDTKTLKFVGVHCFCNVCGHEEIIKSIGHFGGDKLMSFNVDFCSSCAAFWYFEDSDAFDLFPLSVI